MSGLIWISLCILGVHVAVGLFIVIYTHRAYKLLESRSDAAVGHLSDVSVDIKRASSSLAIFGDKTKSALRSLVLD